MAGSPLAPQVMQGDIDRALGIGVTHDQCIQRAPRRRNGGGIGADERRTEELVHQADDGGHGLPGAPPEIAPPVGQRRGLAIADQAGIGRHAHQDEVAEGAVSLAQRKSRRTGRRKAEAWMERIFIRTRTVEVLIPCYIDRNGHDKKSFHIRKLFLTSDCEVLSLSAHPLGVRRRS